MSCKPIGMFALLLLVVLGVGNAVLVWHTHTEVDRRLERIDSAHAQTGKRLDLAQERLDQLAKQIKGVDEQIASLQKHADAASRVTDRLDASLASLEKKMDQSFARLAERTAVPEVVEPLKTPPVPQSVAVLPFVYVTQVKDRAPDFVLNYLASSLTSGLLKKRLPLTPLSLLAGHKKGGTAGREEYAWRNAQQAGQWLGVEYVLAGIVTEGGGFDLQLHVELLRSDSGALVWTGRYDFSQKSEEFERTATRTVEQIVLEVAEKITEKKAP